MNGVSFSASGHRLLTAHGDETLRVWDLRPFDGGFAELDEVVRCHVPYALERGHMTLLTAGRTCTRPAR